MKKNLLSLGFIGLAAFFASCSDDATSPMAPPTASISSSSTFVGLSSNTQPINYSSAATIIIDKKDTTIKKEIITVSGSSIEYPDIVADPMFCWTDGCEKTVKPPSSSSKAAPVAKSSSSAGGITIDTPEEKKPVVQGLVMTDTRDNQNYALVQVGSKLWMAQDINYAVANSECYNESDANCATNGRLYTFNAAQKACPSGWRLPSREEAQTVIDSDSYSWSYSGRCKDGDCNFLGQMGFHWTSATPQEGDKNFDSNKGDSYTVIIVEKEPEYAGENVDLKFFQIDSKTKRFSVRCVQE
jgi:uncharacterized protein (TIGR02145 family)